MDNNPINLNNPLGLDPPAEGEEMQVGEKNLTRTKVNGDDLTTEQKKSIEGAFPCAAKPNFSKHHCIKTVRKERVRIAARLLF